MQRPTQDRCPRHDQVYCLQNPATLPIIVLRAESDELATVRTELTGGKKFYAVATHLDLYDPEVRLPARQTWLLHSRPGRGATGAAIRAGASDGPAV